MTFYRKVLKVKAPRNQRASSLSPAPYAKIFVRFRLTPLLMRLNPLHHHLMWQLKRTMHIYSLKLVDMSIKHICLSLLLISTAFVVKAQSPKYESAMSKNVAILDTTKNAETLQQLANNFERIGNAEKTQWMPFYYASMCLVNQLWNPAMKSKIDEYADRAEKLAAKADSLSPKNSEVMCLYSMINSLRIMVDPASRGMQYSMVSRDYLDKAKQYNAQNPRTYFLQAMSLMYTPEQYGGGKAVAKPMFQKAVDLFAKEKPAKDYEPHWGGDKAQMFLKQIDQ